MSEVTDPSHAARLPSEQDAQPLPAVYTKGRLRIDFDAYEVWVDGKPVHLMRREFQLLRFFLQWPNRVFDRTQLLARIWAGKQVHPRSLDTHIYRLRRCIELDPLHPELLVTVRGVGWKFSERALADDDARADIGNERLGDNQGKRDSGQTDHQHKRKGEKCNHKQDERS